MDIKTGAALSRARQKSGISQGKLASICGVTRFTIYRWEQAGRLLPMVELALGKVFDDLERQHEDAARDVP